RELLGVDALILDAVAPAGVPEPLFCPVGDLAVATELHLVEPRALEQAQRVAVGGDRYRFLLPYVGPGAALSAFGRRPFGGVVRFPGPLPRGMPRLAAGFSGRSLVGGRCAGGSGLQGLLGGLGCCFSGPWHKWSSLMMVDEING